MRLPPLQYVRARSVEEAVRLFGDHPGARYLAGGTDLLNQARCGACPPVFRGGSCAPPGVVIDLKGIPEMTGVNEDPDGGLTIGAATPIATVTSHALVAERYPVLALCCSRLGSYPLRHRATIGGNICNASPCADSAAALLALEAEVRVTGPEGERRISIQDFFQGPGQTALRAGELVTAVRLSRDARGLMGHYGRIARRRAVDISSVAVLVARDRNGPGRHRVCLLSVAPTPLRVSAAEQALDEQGSAGAEQAAQLAREACSPITDVRATAAYRKDMVGVLTRRGVEALTMARED